MLVAVLFVYFTNLMNQLAGKGQALDFHLGDNNYYVAFVRFSVSVNNFIPVVDGLLPILLLQGLMVGAGTFGKVIRYLINLVRGAGA